MELWRLATLIFISFILGLGCQSPMEEEELFLMHNINGPILMDSLIVVSLNGEYFFSGKSFQVNYRDCQSSQCLILKLDTCENILNLEVDSKVSFICDPLYPFMGKEVYFLAAKDFFVEGKKYRVFKLYNMGKEPFDYSTTFWSESGDLLLIKLGEGWYFELEGKYESLIDEVKEDFYFSYLKPIPPVPPIPSLQKSQIMQ